MENPAGESNDGALRLDFDRRLKLEFHGSWITSDAGLLTYRELDDALGLSSMAGEVLADVRTGVNGRHAPASRIRLRPSHVLFGSARGIRTRRKSYPNKINKLKAEKVEFQTLSLRHTQNCEQLPWSPLHPAGSDKI